MGKRGGGGWLVCSVCVYMHEREGRRGWDLWVRIVFIFGGGGLSGGKEEGAE